MPVNFYAGGKVYKNWVDITPSKAYELFLKDPDSFKTSAASPEDFLQAYRKASKQAKDILCITCSSKISAIHEIAMGTREQIKSELPQTSIEVLDSQTVTAAEGFVALAAARAAADGKNLAQVSKAAKIINGKVEMVILLDTIRHVYRSGRIPKIAAQAGAMLNIRPILTSSHGLIRFLGAVRNRERGIDRILKIMRDKAGQSPVHVAVMHAYVPDEAESLKERVASEFNCAELWLTEFSPVMGYATGTGTIGFGFYPED